MADEVSLRDELFPDGQPSPEELIGVLAEYIRAKLEMDEDVSDNCPTT